jgi:hypothetical protein
LSWLHSGLACPYPLQHGYLCQSMVY